MDDKVWLPWQNTAMELTVIGIAVGGLSGFVTYKMLQFPETAADAPLVGFCIGVAAFLLLLSGVNIPISHHIALGASYGVLMSGSVLWGIAGGIIGAFAGDYLARLFLVYGDCWVDPPGMSTSLTSFLYFFIAPKINLFNEQIINIVPIVNRKTKWSVLNPLLIAVNGGPPFHYGCRHHYDGNFRFDCGTDSISYIWRQR